MGLGLSENKLKQSEEMEEPKSVEDILEKIGGFSWFQAWACLVLLLPELPSAMNAMSPLLIGSTIISHKDYSCANHPRLNLTSDNFCQVVGNCSQLVYTGNLPHTSIVTEWNMFCDRAWMVDLVTSVQMCGNTVGALLFSLMADRYGRRTLFFVTCLMMGICGVAGAWAPNVAIYASLRFMSGLSIGGLYVLYLNYLMEFLVPSCRTICGCVTFWAFGEMLLALIGYLLPAWRQLSVIIALPLLIIPLAFPWLPESPRWLLSQNRTSEANVVFTQIARWNGRQPVTMYQVQSVQNEILNQRSKVKDVVEGGCRRLGMFEMFRPNSLGRQFLLLIVIWFIMSLIYYALSFNTKNLGGDQYLNIFYLGLSELPGPFSGLLLNNRLGRKRTMVGFMTIGSGLLSLLVLIQVLPPHLFSEINVGEVTKVLALVGRYCIAAAFAIMACATAESFPTKVRVTYSGVCGFFGNIGGILAPQLVFLATVWPSSPYITCCLLAIIVTILCMSLKETSETPLSDSYSSIWR